MIIITWEDIQQSAKELVELVAKSGEQFDAVVGIGGSGLPHAVLVARALKLPLVPFMVSSYSGRERKDPEIRVEPDVDLKGKRLLVVDDIVASGETFKVVKERLLGKFEAASVKTAAAFLSLLVCKDYPDYYARPYERKPDEWILFPWDDPKDFPLPPTGPTT
jgi:hypoxanthine phosphoribosyltransferase